MIKLCIFTGATVGSYVGWFLGMKFGIWTAYFISGFGSMAGVYAGWKFAQRFR